MHSMKPTRTGPSQYLISNLHRATVSGLVIRMSLSIKEFKKFLGSAVNLAKFILEWISNKKNVCIDSSSDKACIQVVIPDKTIKPPL